ncbi:uncharacterized protein [Aquarana catesbeiana]|uniref:uncharacterized protein n=1 Tax=Aquarana catesbeiana TaxID=8400 RepID=UPI003CC98002
MPRRKAEGSRPQKLIEFFPPGPRQNGDGTTSTQVSRHTQILSQKGKSQKRNSPPRGSQSSPATPASGSPEKSRARMDAADEEYEVSSAHDSGDDTRELPNSIDQFPTTNQPVMDTILKEMLVSLRSSLHSDMLSCIHTVNRDLQEVSERVTYVEDKMGKFATTINALVDANESNEDDIDSIKAKMADMEDRARKNNVKICGIPESVLQQDLRNYVSQLFTTVLPEMSAIDFTVDRIHRLPKPTHLPVSVPRDVILRLHFYHTKEKLINLGTITKALRNHKLSYKWGFPTKLIVTKDGKQHIMDSVDKGMELLSKWVKKNLRVIVPAKPIGTSSSPRAPLLHQIKDSFHPILCQLDHAALQIPASALFEWDKRSDKARKSALSTVPTGPKCDYMMIAPFKLTSGSQSRVCTWLKSEVSVTIVVHLEYFSVKLNIVSKPDTPSHYECTEFTVPEVGKETQVFFTFLATGDKVNVADRKAAVIDVPRSACLAQRNKQMYKQAETIQIRMPCYDENLNQVVRNFTKATLVDPTGARVNQISNPTIDHGVVTVDFRTSEHSRLGYWSIQLEDDKGAIEYTSVQVQRYALPRIDWKANGPDTISVLDRKAEITGTAKYVYGEPVPGTVVVRCCRTVPKYGREANCFRGINDICIEFTKKLDDNGKFSEYLDLDQFKLPFSGLSNYITCDITMKEDGTGVLVPSSCYMPITNRLAVLQLDRTSIGSYYNKVHIPFGATLTDEKGNPLASRTIKVRIDGADVKCLTTDANGRAKTVIDTSSYYKANIILSAVYEDDDLCYGQDEYSNYYINSARSYPYDEMKLYRSYSKSQGHIRIRPLQGQLSCYKNYSMQVHYSFTEGGVGKGATTTSIKYIFMARNNIAAHGEVTVDLSGSYKGSASIKFTIDSTFATGATLMALVTVTEDIISDTASLNIGACFENEMNMEFTEKSVAPEATVDRKITAAPGSFCGLRGQDASFRFLYSYDEFNPNNVYNLVRSYSFGLNYQNIEYKDPELPCIVGNKEEFCNGMYVKPTSSRTDGETYQQFVLSTSYNIMIPKEENSAFDMTTQATALDCFSGVAKKVDVTVSIRYKGDREESGDTIVSVDIMTGYWADFSSVIKVSNIADYRMNGNKALFYLKSVTGTATEFTLSTYLQNEVSTFMTASAVAEVIQTGEMGGARYEYPCDIEPVIEDDTVSHKNEMLPANLSLIPKPLKDHSLPQNYRPISVLNNDLKIFAPHAHTLGVKEQERTGVLQKEHSSGRRSRSKNKKSKRACRASSSPEQYRCPSKRSGWDYGAVPLSNKLVCKDCLDESAADREQDTVQVSSLLKKVVRDSLSEFTSAQPPDQRVPLEDQPGTSASSMTMTSVKKNGTPTQEKSSKEDVSDPLSQSQRPSKSPAGPMVQYLYPGGC